MTTLAILLLAGQAATPPNILARLRAEAEAVRPLARTELGRRWLDAAARLPDPGARVLFQVGASQEWVPESELAQRPEAERKEAKRRPIPPEFYYLTRYGTPLAYLRAFDLAALHGLGDLKGKAVVDFGYGGIGHLRMTAELGARVVGIEVDPLLRALYSGPGDQGKVGEGSLKLVHGFWPAGEGVAAQVGGGFDLFLSKNTLKRGYIHPDKPVDPRRLVHLGVSDEAYLRAVWEALNPGGLMIVYNLAPAQNPPDKEFIPAADPRFPFSREAAEKTGFQVLALDEDDSAFARQMGEKFGWGKPEELQTGLFARYTVLKKP